MRQTIIQRINEALNHLPGDKAAQIADYAEFLVKQHEESALTEGIQKMGAEGKVFDFLNADEDLYSVADLKQQ